MESIIAAEKGTENVTANNIVDRFVMGGKNGLDLFCFLAQWLAFMQLYCLMNFITASEPFF